MSFIYNNENTKGGVIWRLTSHWWCKDGKMQQVYPDIGSYLEKKENLYLWVICVLNKP